MHGDINGTFELPLVPCRPPISAQPLGCSHHLRSLRIRQQMAITYAGANRPPKLARYSRRERVEGIEYGFDCRYWLGLDQS